LTLVRDKLTIPVVYNTGGYELREAVASLEGLVDIYLPDLKYKSSELSAVCSDAPDYFEAAADAIDEMVRQTGAPQLDGEGMLLRGTVIRHLALPGSSEDSMELVRYIAKRWGGEVTMSLMSQYTPQYYKGERKELRRPITSYEYNKIVNLAADLGIHGFMQERSSAKTSYTPDFDLAGVAADKNAKK
ncbi:MAG: radical SAM protein, partial [Angelakisella sp.]